MFRELKSDLNFKLFIETCFPDHRVTCDTFIFTVVYASMRLIPALRSVDPPIVRDITNDQPFNWFNAFLDEFSSQIVQDEWYSSLFFLYYIFLSFLFFLVSFSFNSFLLFSFRVFFLLYRYIVFFIQFFFLIFWYHANVFTVGYRNHP